MKLTTKNIESVNPQDFQTITEGLLFANALESKKVDIYLAVWNVIGETYPTTIEKVNGTWTITRPNISDTQKFELTAFLISEFAQAKLWPYVKDDKGKNTKELMNWTAATRAHKDGKLSESETKAFRAINRFNSWASGYKMQLINEHVRAIVETKVESRMKERKEKENYLDSQENGIKAEETVKAMEEVGRARGAGREALRVIDGKGNVKTGKIKDLPIDTKTSLIKSLITEDKETVEKLFSTVTGKDIKFAPKLQDLKAALLLAELETRMADFKAPTEAMKHIVALKALLLENSETGVTPTAPVKTAGKVKGTKVSQKAA